MKNFKFLAKLQLKKAPVTDMTTKIGYKKESTEKCYDRSVVIWEKCGQIQMIRKI